MYQGTSGIDSAKRGRFLMSGLMALLLLGSGMRYLALCSQSTFGQHQHRIQCLVRLGEDDVHVSILKYFLLFKTLDPFCKDRLTGQLIQLLELIDSLHSACIIIIDTHSNGLDVLNCLSFHFYVFTEYLTHFIITKQIKALILKLIW